MPRGVPMTPEQLAEATAVFERTGNYSAAARAVGVDPDAIARRLRDRKRSDYNARAIDRGLREGRAALRLVIARARGRLTDPTALEPRDLAQVSQSISHAVQRLADLKEAPARRAKLRAETRVADAKAKGLLPPEHVTLVTEPAAVDALFRRTFGFEGAKEGAHDAQPAAGVPDMGGEALSLPASVDRRGE